MATLIAIDEMRSVPTNKRDRPERPGGAHLIGAERHLRAPLGTEQELGQRNTQKKKRLLSTISDKTMPIVVRMAMIEQRISSALMTPST